MHRKLSLLIVITLATVLGVGCGQGGSPAAAGEDKSNKFSDHPEIKEKRDKAVDLLINKCIKCGISHEKARGYYPPVFGELLDSLGEGFAQEIYEQLPDTRGTRTKIKENRDLVV